ncbi:MAG: carbohydrate ABC transporter permease [Chloroflexota bacterium]|nr:MAG: sugar ABC transporter permease [Chloroflexota bacterium]
MARNEYRIGALSLNVARYVIVIFGAIVMVVPFLWMINSSLMTTSEITRQPPVWFPATPQFSNFTGLLEVVPMHRLYLNSIIVAAATVLGVLFTSSIAGFAFAKYQFPGRDLLFYMILATMMVPFFITLIPVFYIVRQLGWINTFQGLVVPGIFSAYGIFLMRQFISTLPDELLDAARIDGASEPLIYARIIVPLVKPALATLGTFTFIGVWNAFLWPLLVISDRDLMTVPLGLNSLRLYAAEARNLHLLMAGTALSVVPTLVIFIFLQRYFIRGIALTGLKG